MIQNEGIADQIDKYMGYKKYYSDIFKSPELAKIFTTLYDKAEDDIKQLQTIIVQYSKNDIDKKTMIDKLLEVYKLTDMPLASICRTKLSKPDLRMK